jgi:hypothetical protein
MNEFESRTRRCPIPRDYGAASTRKSKILHQPSTIYLQPCTLYRAICAWILLSFAFNLKPDASHFSMHLQPCTLHPVFILYRRQHLTSNPQHQCLVPCPLPSAIQSRNPTPSYPVNQSDSKLSFHVASSQQRHNRYGLRGLCPWQYPFFYFEFLMTVCGSFKKTIQKEQTQLIRALCIIGILCK